MTKKILLLSTIIASSIVLSSYEFGPAAFGSVNCTGSTGGAASCSGGGACHSSNTSNTMVEIKLMDSLGNTITQYHPGSTYKVKITGSNSASQPGYGFQVSVVNSNKKQIGIFSLGSTPNDSIHRTDVIAPLQIIEHFRPLIPSVAGNYITPDFYWTAPASDSGNATFYVMLNAVNRDNNYTGDQPNSGTPLVITPEPTSVTILEQNIGIKTYPNPVYTNLNIQIDNALQGTYTFQVFDLNGRKVFTQDATVASTDFQTSINTAAWTNGVYLLQIMKDGAQRTVQFIKQ